MHSAFDLDMANDDEVLQSKLMIRHLGSAEKVLVSVSTVLVNHANSIDVVSRARMALVVTQ